MAKPQCSKYGFGDPSFSWNAYDHYRPTYPPSVWSRILSYHRNKRQTQDYALDLGCGSGAATATLAHHFPSLNLVDPNEHNLNAAKGKFASQAFQDSLPHPCTFSYHVSPAEELVVEVGSQDMVDYLRGATLD